MVYFKQFKFQPTVEDGRDCNNMDKWQKYVSQQEQKKVREIEDQINYLPSYRLTRRLIKKAKKELAFFKAASPSGRKIREVMLRIEIDSTEARRKRFIHRIFQFITIIGAALVSI